MFPIILLAIYINFASAALKFSGVYSSDKEVYAGAFLMTKNRFIEKRDSLQKASFCEGVIFNMIGGSRSLLLRDYFDFAIEHLSSSSNGAADNIDLLKILNNKMNKTSYELEASVEAADADHLKRTIGVIPFSDVAANAHFTNAQELQRNVRLNFFKSTFYSLYRYFKHIIVYVSSSNDIDTVKSLNIPYWKIIDLSHTLSLVPREKYFFYDVERTNPRPMSQLLPKYALLHTMDMLETDSTKLYLESSNIPIITSARNGETIQKNNVGDKFDYIYYTEGDQILHMRHHIRIYEILLAGQDKKYIFIPHRMQV